MNKQNNAFEQRQYKILVLYGILLLAMIIFLLSILKTVSSKRRMPSHTSILHDRSLRGSIISADGYTLSSSTKTYKASIRGESIKKEKRELFIKLFSIYSSVPEKELRKKLKTKNGKMKKGYIILSNNISSRKAMQLKSLALKLRRLSVFKPIGKILQGLDITENGEARQFPLKDVMSPVLGYVQKVPEGNYIRPLGLKGIEGKYNGHLASKKDGYLEGKRDVTSAIVRNKEKINKIRSDGLNVHLNIPLSLQRRVEIMLDSMKDNLDAEEILLGVMQSKTGKVLALASTKRYDPEHILDISTLNPKFSEYLHEAGSVLKPITISVALDNNLVTPKTNFNLFNGKMKIGRRSIIRDHEKFESLSVAGIVIHSSNIGTSLISWRLTGKEFRDGLLKFGISKPSGIDLTRNLSKKLKKAYILNHKTHRANASYGYGMTVTFAQLLKAYSAFNNDGIAVTPRIVDYLESKKGELYRPNPEVADINCVSKKTANQMKSILIDAVKKGTGVKAQYPGLEIGGKTGTAHIVKNGRYVREYHSSFYGFANDKKGNTYTIGVLVIRAKKRGKYFASQSAVPTFRNTVQILANQGYLVPELSKEDKIVVNKPIYVAEDDLAFIEPIEPPHTDSKDALKNQSKKAEKISTPAIKIYKHTKKKSKIKRVKPIDIPKDDLDMF